MDWKNGGRTGSSELAHRLKTAAVQPFFRQYVMSEVVFY